MIKFYLTLFAEVIFFPFFFIAEELKKRFNLTPDKKYSVRTKANSNKLMIVIHDWAGYNLKRFKKFKNNKQIECGLEYQIARLDQYKGKKDVQQLVTISGADKFNTGKYGNLKIHEVPDAGLDFSGYSYAVKNLSDENAYLLLMNTSVERSEVNFIDDYISFMEDNPHVGLLGISYSTKVYQSLIRNNFAPHIQSFFLLSTMAVFKQIESYAGSFPGEGISYKRLLIREGEVKISQIVKKLGYALAIIDESGKPYIFPEKGSFSDTPYKKWTLPMGDYRYHVDTPNKINAIKYK